MGRAVPVITISKTPAIELGNTTSQFLSKYLNTFTPSSHETVFVWRSLEGKERQIEETAIHVSSTNVRRYSIFFPLKQVRVTDTSGSANGSVEVSDANAVTYSEERNDAGLFSLQKPNADDLRSDTSSTTSVADEPSSGSDSSLSLSLSSTPSDHRADEKDVPAATDHPASAASHPGTVKDIFSGNATVTTCSNACMDNIERGHTCDHSDRVRTVKSQPVHPVLDPFIRALCFLYYYGLNLGAPRLYMHRCKSLLEMPQASNAVVDECDIEAAAFFSELMTQLGTMASFATVLCGVIASLMQFLDLTDNPVAHTTGSIGLVTSLVCLAISSLYRLRLCSVLTPQQRWDWLQDASMASQSKWRSVPVLLAAPVAWLAWSTAALFVFLLSSMWTTPSDRGGSSGDTSLGGSRAASGFLTTVLCIAFAHGVVVVPVFWSLGLCAPAVLRRTQ